MDELRTAIAAVEQGKELPLAAEEGNGKGKGEGKGKGAARRKGTNDGRSESTLADDYMYQTGFESTCLIQCHAKLTLYNGVHAKQIKHLQGRAVCGHLLDPNAHTNPAC